MAKQAPITVREDGNLVTKLAIQGMVGRNINGKPDVRKTPLVFTIANDGLGIICSILDINDEQGTTFTVNAQKLVELMQVHMLEFNKDHPIGGGGTDG